MKRKQAVQNNLLYRYRYPLAGIVLALVAVFMVVYQFWSTPSGLSTAEIASATRSSNLSLTNLLSHPTDNLAYIANLPWLLVQSLSINIFGLSVMSVRLPAVILTLLSIGLLIVLLRRLTKPNLAMMGGLLMVSSFFAISLSRCGIPAVMTTLLLTLLALMAHTAINSDRVKSQRLAMVGSAILLGLLCYMTAGIYLAIIILAVIILHPRLRLVLRSNKKRLLMSIVAFIVVVAPLLIAMALGFMSGQIGQVVGDLVIIGLPSLDNLRQFIGGYVGVQSSLVGGMVTPMLTIVGAIMVVIGLIYVVYDGHSSVRCYATMGIVLITVLLGSCQPALIYLLFIPTVILQTLCLAYLTNKWYGLFPSNPYARVFAILPVAILIGSLCSLDAGRYFNAVNYNRTVVYQYDQSLPVLTGLLSDNQQQAYDVVVPQNQVDFYRPLTHSYSNIHVYGDGDIDRLNDWSKDGRDANTKLIILASTGKSAPTATKLSALRTSWLSDDSVVLRVYDRIAVRQ